VHPLGSYCTVHLVFDFTYISAQRTCYVAYSQRMYPRIVYMTVGGMYDYATK